MSYTHRLLITGGCGFIGSNFINHMLKNSVLLIVNIDRLDYCASTRNINVSTDNYRFVKGDIKSSDLLNFILTEFEIDTVIHFAAQSHVCNSFTNSLNFTQDNILGTHTLLESCRQYGKIKRFIHVSTDEVYGDQFDGKAVTESSMIMPTNCYAASKAAAEMIVRSYQLSFNMPIIITRGNNVYGPSQYPEKLIPKFIMSLLNNEKCTVHGDGSSRRNFLYIDDVVSAFETILFKGEIGKVYNIGTDNEYSVIEIADKLRTLIASDKSLADIIINVPDRNINDKRYLITSDPLRKLGWSEQVSFEEGLTKTIDWYKQFGHTNWNY